MAIPRHPLLGWIVCSLLFTVGLPAGTAHPAASSEPVIATFVADDHQFRGPDQLAAGQTILRLQNRGDEPHQLQLLKVTEGNTPADLAAALQDFPAQIPAWAKHMGGPNAVGAGETSQASVYLTPGSYLLICLIPGKGGLPHVAQGMLKTLHVMDQGPTSPSFRADYHMAMQDYEFVVVEPITRGTHSFYVINRGSRPHQVSLVRLEPEASVEQVLAAFGPMGHHVMPGKLVGGLSGLEPGERGVFTAALTPGRYAMICLFPNPTAPESHAAKGMMMHFTVD